MTLNSLFASIGAMTGVALTIVVFLLAGPGWILLTVGGGVVLVTYIVAALTITPATRVSEYFRGLLVGLNSCLNGCLIYSLLHLVAPLAVALTLGVAIGVINLLAALRWISQREVYQGIIGWLNWVLPMSWPIVALGLTFVLFSLLLALLTVFKVDYLRLQGGRIDWATGTFFVKGGLISNMNAWDTAFNMGNFAFVDKNSSHWEIQHEAGHTLNLAAFGWVFHLIGAFDEIVLHRGANAYSERIAESNDTGTGSNNIPMWA
jgi:hypothetical protein